MTAMYVLRSRLVGTLPDAFAPDGFPHPTHPIMIRAPDAAQRVALRGAVRCRAGAVPNSGVWYGPGSAQQREERCSASGTRRLRRPPHQIVGALVFRGDEAEPLAQPHRRIEFLDQDRDVL